MVYFDQDATILHKRTKNINSRLFFYDLFVRWEYIRNFVITNNVAKQNVIEILNKEM